MNTNKKYAIRKLAVGVASVSIGLFVNNAINGEVTTNMGIVGNVAHASESKLIYSNPNPNGDVDSEGTSNNAISKIEVLNETAEKIRLKISIADDIDVSKGFKIANTNNLSIPFDEVLSFNGEKIGQISSDYSSNELQSPKDFQTIDEYYNYLKNLDLSSVSIKSQKITFNDNFKKYNKNRYIEFDINKNQDKTIYLDILTVKNEIPNEKLQKIIDWEKQLQGVLYLNNKKIHTSDLTTNIKISTLKEKPKIIKEIKYNEKTPLHSSSTYPVGIKKTPSYFRTSGVPNTSAASYSDNIETYIDGKGKTFLKAGTKLRLKLNSNVLTFSNDNKEGNDILGYTEGVPKLTKTSEVFNGEQILKEENSNNNKDISKTIKTHYKKIDENTYEIELLEDIITENNSLNFQHFVLNDLLYKAEFKDDFLNHLNLNEYKKALQTEDVGKLFGTVSLEIKKPEETNYTTISEKKVIAEPSTSFTFGESSRGTVKVKYVDENNKEISSLETIAENQPWYNKYEITKKAIPGYEYVSASQPLVDLIMSGEKVVTLTYRSVEKTREIPFNTIYQEDPTKDKGYKETIVKGATGIEGYKDSDSKYKRIIKEKTDEIVKVGTKSTTVTEKLLSPVRYEKDSSREKGQENITVKGKDGSKTTTTTYTVNTKTGEVVSNVGKPVVVEPTETVVKVAAKDKIVYSKDGNNVIKETTTYNVNSKTGEITEKTTREVLKENGAKDKVSTEKLPSLVRYEKDGSREKGQENITIKGKDGSKTTTTTYTVNDKTGEVVPNVGKPVVVEPTETVVKVAAKDKIVYSKEGNNVVKETTTYNVNPKTGEITEKTTREVFKENGAKDKVSVEKLPSPVRYEKDGSREKGQENITIKGKDGSKTTTTTYTVNDKTGEVVENVGKPVVVNPTETVVKVAAKDKVSVEKLISPVRYEKDTTREKGQENITVKGKDGSKTTTTTYTVNDKTGEVVENVGKSVVVNPTETVVKVATKDKVVVEKLPSPVRYEKDNSREKGQEKITVKGKDGSKTTTTTYTVNPKTGEIVPNVGKSVVVESTETVVKVAAKDKVEVVNKKDGETIRITTSY